MAVQYKELKKDYTREPERDYTREPERDYTREPERGDTCTNKVAPQIHIDMEKVHQHLIKKGIEVSIAKLKKNQQFLKDVGCLDEQLYCYPKILSYSDYELVQYVRRLNGLGYKKMSVGLLRVAMRYNKALKHKVEAYMKDSFKESASVMNVFGCDQNELESLLQKFAPAMELMTTDPRKLQERVELLRQNGYSVQEIIDCPGVLEKSVSLLSDRLKIVERICRLEGLSEKLPLEVLCKSRFDEHLPRLISSGQLLTDSQKLRKFAEMFQVDENNIVLKRPVKRVSMAVTAEKILTLQEAGFIEKEIMSKPVILSYSNKSIKEAIEYVGQGNEDFNVDLNQLSNVLQQKHHKSKKHPEYILKHIASCLDIDFSPFSKSQRHLIHDAPFITVTENMNFLERSGFSKSDIRSCPMILVQEFDLVWRSYLKVANLEKFKHFKENNVKYLNAMQYLIEFDRESDYFDSSVHVDRED